MQKLLKTLKIFIGIVFITANAPEEFEKSQNHIEEIAPIVLNQPKLTSPNLCPTQILNLLPKVYKTSNPLFKNDLKLISNWLGAVDQKLVEIQEDDQQIHSVIIPYLQQKLKEIINDAAEQDYSEYQKNFEIFNNYIQVVKCDSLFDKLGKILEDEKN